MNAHDCSIDVNHHLLAPAHGKAIGMRKDSGTRRANAAAPLAGIVARAALMTQLMAALVIALAALPASAQEAQVPVPGSYASGGNLAMVRFEFDNDTFVGSDDVFSAGWSLQLHSGLKDRWDGPLGSKIGRLPLLGDDGEGGRVVRRAFGISQNIFSPENLTITELQPNDAPYAGTLGVHGSWASYDNKRLAAIQLYAGCMGPCSYAEEVQKFVHEDMGRGEPPKGWDNQLDTKWLGNVNFAWRHKVLAPEEKAYYSRWANDLSIGGQVAAGNAARFIDGQVEYRVGWGLPMGFTHIPDPAPRGVVLDPVYVKAGALPAGRPDGFRAYASVVVRATAIDNVIVRDGGRTVNGGYHPGFEANEDAPELLVGLHTGFRGYALHVTYYRFLSSRTEYGPGSSTDWANISFERRF